MRILVYGAGVIGANLAADLFASGRDVKLLARGPWADTLEKNGLTVKSAFFPGKRTYPIPVLRELQYDDEYDVIFVVLRFSQLDDVLPILRNNVSKNIALIGNDPWAPNYREKLPGKNVLFGFYMAAGHREPDRVVSFSLKKITIGQLREDPGNEDLIRNIFDGTKIQAVYQPNMEDYLLCHAAFVVPIAFACYHADGDLKKIHRDRAYLHRIIDANIEGYQAIEDAGHEILPASDRDYHSEKYRKLCYRVYKIMCSTRIGKVCASDHAMNAVEELEAMNEALKRFFDAHRASCPTYRQLEADAQKHLNHKTDRGGAEKMSGIAYGVGVGPGDPELMTQKAIRLIRENDVIALPGQAAKGSVAYGIAVAMVPELAQKELVPIPMPMVRDRERLRVAHAEGARRIESYLDRGKNVVYLTLGDPSIYGSFSYLQRILLADGYAVETVPGVPSFCAAAARLDLPLVEGDEPLHVAPAARGTDEMLRLPGTWVLMKTDGPLAETKARLTCSGREVFAVENCGMATERLYRTAEELPDSTGYLSLIVAREPRRQEP